MQASSPAIRAAETENSEASESIRLARELVKESRRMVAKSRKLVARSGELRARLNATLQRSRTSTYSPTGSAERVAEARLDG